MTSALQRLRYAVDDLRARIEDMEGDVWTPVSRMRPDGTRDHVPPPPPEGPVEFEMCWRRVPPEKKTP